MAATATKRKKQTEKKATPRNKMDAARKAVASAPARTTKATKDEEPFKVGDRALPGMEDINERIGELDDECQRCLGFADTQKSAKSDKDTSLGKIGELLKKHKLEYYVVNGKKFYEEPGSPSVKMVNVKQNG